MGIHKNIFLNEIIYCGYSLEATQQGAFNEYHRKYFHGEKRKKSVLLGWKNALSRATRNSCHAGQVKIPRPLLISSQSDYLIWVFDRISHI